MYIDLCQLTGFANRTVKMSLIAFLIRIHHDQPAHPNRHLLVLLVNGFAKEALKMLLTNSVVPDQTLRRHRLIRGYTDRKCNKGHCHKLTKLKKKHTKTNRNNEKKKRYDDWYNGPKQ